jgi:hypothetical protein
MKLILAVMTALSLSTILATNVFAQASAPNTANASDVDGELFLSESDAVAAGGRSRLSGSSGYFGPFGTDDPFTFHQDLKIKNNVIYQRQIARWKDPLTLPHSRAECVKWASGHIPGDGDWKMCVGWKTQFQWMYVSAFIRVTTAKQEDIGKAIDECFKEAAIAGALAAIITGGTAALGAFEGVIKVCLLAKLPTLVTATAYTSSGWGSWE